MMRFHLQIREPGAEPRSVPVGEELTIGHARRADICLQDAAVGNELFRVGVENGTVFVEGLSRAGLLRFGNQTIGFGQRQELGNGATLSVGGCTLQLLDTARSAAGGTAPPAEDMERTMMPGKGYRPGQSQLPAQQPTPSRPAGDPEQTVPTTKGYRPGQQPGPAPQPAPAPTKPPAADAVEQTMVPGKGYRPGQQAGPGPQATTGQATPHTAAAGEQTSMPAKGYRPGQQQDPQQPQSATAAAAAAPVAQGSTPQAANAPAGAPPVQAAQPPGDEIERTLPDARIRESNTGANQSVAAGAASAPDSSLEARCRDSRARLFLKADSLKRSVPLRQLGNRVGRSPDAEVSIPNRMVSELHAILEFGDNGWTIRDLGSTNGTMLGEQVVQGDPHRLTNHALVSFGTIRALFLCEDASAKDAAHELRAVRWLVSKGKLPKQVADDLAARRRADPSLPVAETLLQQTTVTPSDWAEGMLAASSAAGPLGSLFSVLGRIFSR